MPRRVWSARIVEADNKTVEAIEKVNVNVYLCGHVHNRNGVKKIMLTEKDVDNKRVIGGKFTDIDSSGSVKTMSVQILSRGADRIDILDLEKEDK